MDDSARAVLMARRILASSGLNGRGLYQVVLGRASIWQTDTYLWAFYS